VHRGVIQAAGVIGDLAQPERAGTQRLVVLARIEARRRSHGRQQRVGARQRRAGHRELLRSPAAVDFANHDKRLGALQGVGRQLVPDILRVEHLQALFTDAAEQIELADRPQLVGKLTEHEGGQAPALALACGHGVGQLCVVHGDQAGGQRQRQCADQRGHAPARQRREPRLRARHEVVLVAPEQLRRSAHRIP
jgi:hypothetical protein